ncbi:MAG TPA: sigma factor-like helix-turn-helix DNA-binding protein, partial [Bacteroidales bacterium]|nr:sigma factor-like helix-turn-helix DNA-binding protein [Bacteroidales bacterium]
IGYVLNEREQYIFMNNFGFFNDSQKRTLQSIGDQYGITRERVRQIAQKIPEKLESIVNKIAQRFITIEKHFDYNLDLKKELLVIDDDLVSKINKLEGVSFTGKFYGLVFAGTFQRYYMAFQDMENNYNYYYLVSRKYKEIFDFRKYFTAIETIKEKRIEKSYQIDAQDFLNKFVSPHQTTNDRLKQICRRMAMEEFGLGFDKTTITFNRNTLIKLSEHILKILEDVGHPMKLTEICKELKMRTTRIPPNIESLRSSILSIEEVVAIGKTSTYALKKWQTVKTGTIKELVKEFLEASEEPKHISDITVYVCKFRNTSDKNILSNLKLDKTNTFIFFRKSYIGLKYKQYNNLPAGNDKGGRGRKPKGSQ